MLSWFEVISIWSQTRDCFFYCLLQLLMVWIAAFFVYPVQVKSQAVNSHLWISTSFVPLHLHSSTLKRSCGCHANGFTSPVSLGTIDQSTRTHTDNTFIETRHKHISCLNLFIFTLNPLNVLLYFFLLLVTCPQLCFMLSCSSLARED